MPIARSLPFVFVLALSWCAAASEARGDTPREARPRLVVIDGGGNDSAIGDEAAYSFRLYRELFLAGDSTGDGVISALVLTYADPTDAEWMKGAREIAEYLAWVGKSVSQSSDAKAMTIPDRRSAEHPSVDHALRDVDIVFLRGGDQGKYYDFWNGTRLERALRDFFARGGVFGGTSAGSMSAASHCLCGSFGPVSSELLEDGRSPLLRDESDPSSSGVHDDFLSLIPGTFIETHLSQRARHGRFLATLAEAHEVNGGQPVLGIGLEVQTGIIVRNGFATVVGMGEVLFARESRETKRTREPGKPLVYTHITVDRLLDGQTFALEAREPLNVPRVETQPVAPNWMLPAIFEADAGGEDRAVKHERVFESLSRSPGTIGVLSFAGSSAHIDRVGGMRLQFGLEAPSAKETSTIVVDASRARVTEATPWDWTYEKGGSGPVTGLHGLVFHVLSSPWKVGLLTKTPMR